MVVQEDRLRFMFVSLMKDLSQNMGEDNKNVY